MSPLETMAQRRRGVPMWLGKPDPGQPEFTFAEPVYFPYRQAVELEDGRILVEKTSDACIVMTPDDWRRAIADINTLISGDSDG